MNELNDNTVLKQTNTSKQSGEVVLEVKDLNTNFTIRDKKMVTAVNNVSFTLKKGETLGVVGESGSGKSQLFLSIIGLLAKNGLCTGSAKLSGKEILNLPSQALNKIRGSKISMIFQDPMTSLNPFLKIKSQMTEVLIEHLGYSYRDALKSSIEMLDLVSIPSAKQRINLYPHEFSGGMRQRVMIAMSLLCKPDILIADEPTTALDVTIQAEILDLIYELRNEFNMSVVMITHDLGVVAKVCEDVMVMYGGKIMEMGTVDDIFYKQKHPYTRGLLNSMPRIDQFTDRKLQTIMGQPPNMQEIPIGCPFEPRCNYKIDKCRNQIPPLQNIEHIHTKACFVDI